MSRTRYLLVLPAALSGALACEGFVLNPHGEDPSGAEQPAWEGDGPAPNGQTPGGAQNPNDLVDDQDESTGSNAPTPGGHDADAGAPPSRTETAADAGAPALSDAARRGDAQ